ncbi:hypothetical protein B0I35DRAFT_81856 [Stachybotrys elegans]|uniref:Uncharacterized protein n=1 Tax=Stachybotrys elegans TaxID=80388 RepID=A0A8K0SN90_9HYPO|nr:hypothetical protein B0I35DRAFT_81856 [Stachybotrys elegans]
MASEGTVSQFSIPLPRSLDTRIYLRLSTHAKAIMLSLTTATQDDAGTARPMGSFVYALPDRFNAQQPLATTLFSMESTVEFTTRLARLLARKTQLPVYVSNSMSLESAGMGGTVEEEMEAFKSIVEVSLDRLRNSGTIASE